MSDREKITYERIATIYAALNDLQKEEFLILLREVEFGSGSVAGALNKWNRHHREKRL